MGGLCVLGAALYVCRRHDRYVKQMSARGGSDNDLSSPLLEMSDSNGSFITPAANPPPPADGPGSTLAAGAGSTPVPQASPLAAAATEDDTAAARVLKDAGQSDAVLDVSDATLEQQEDEAVMNMFENRRALKALAEAAGAGGTTGGGRGRSKGRRGSGRSKQRVPRVQFDVDTQGV